MKLKTYFILNNESTSYRVSPRAFPRLIGRLLASYRTSLRRQTQAEGVIAAEVAGYLSNASVL